VADVQIAVGLRREAGMHSFAGKLTAFGDIFFNKSMDEVFAFGNFSHYLNLSLVNLQ
jgi:hypothetical protein